jgi:hypothetical protein
MLELQRWTMGYQPEQRPQNAGDGGPWRDTVHIGPHARVPRAADRACKDGCSKPTSAAPGDLRLVVSIAKSMSTVVIPLQIHQEITSG